MTINKASSWHTTIQKSTLRFGPIILTENHDDMQVKKMEPTGKKKTEKHISDTG